MKTGRRRERRTNLIGTGRWTAYMTAAAATSWVAANSAEAAIHYSGLINEGVSGGARITLPLDAGGSLVLKHFKLVYGSSSVPDGGTAAFYVYGAVSGAVNGFTSACDTETASVAKLNVRDSVAAGPFVSGGGLLASNYGSGCNGKRGQFLQPGQGFIGFKFNTGAGVRYGWARVNMQGPPGNKYRLVDYAYGDPGDKVLVGQRSSRSTPSLESLGALAMGATGLLAWRQSRRVAVR